jgi:hypothetical protein
LRAAFLVALLFVGRRVLEVFNTVVDNAVEKHGSILVSDATRDGSALCTGASAGTFVLHPSEAVVVF